MQASLRHEAQEPNRLERGCFAPSIRSSDNQRPIVWTEANINWDGRGEQRMAGGKELQAMFLGQAWSNPLHVSTQTSLGRDKVNVSQEAERLFNSHTVNCHLLRELP
jgi:hypothetical protein